MSVRASAVLGYGYRYRRWVLDSLKYIDAQDLATGGEHIPELDELYVDVVLADRGPAGEDIPRRHSISELLDPGSSAVLALIGQPGSGKSTLLAHTARRGARTLLPGMGRKRIPVLLALRDQAGSILADPSISLADVIRAAVADGPGREPNRWWERQLGRGRCLVLLDGLDEVARDDARLTVADWVERQIKTHPGNQFVVTSRPYGLPDSLTAQAEVLVIRPFTPDQVRLFLDRWFLAAERHSTGGSGRGDRRAVEMRARESADRLVSRLGQHPALGELAANPLLLTMIATAHRYRGALPGGRADLYGEICHVLLSRRGRAKDLPEVLSWPAKQALLSALAYQMMRERASSLPAERVIQILRPQFERFSSSVTVDVFLDDIARNGMFTGTQAGGYAFTHLTFQEYLAARQVSASPELVRTLADNVSDPWWHETILLYAATGDASPIVRACIESGTVPALILAFDCADAGAELDPELRQRLDAERQRAFEPDCPAGHRRVIAGVEGARLTRQTITTAAGTRICAQAVPGDLYWLFLTDTQAPQPDSPCDPRAGQPATGVWGQEARRFARWLDSITATATGTEIRFPRPEELAEDAVAGALGDGLPAVVTGAWTQPDPAQSWMDQPRMELWVRPGRPHPHELSGAALRRVVAVDTGNSGLVPQVLTAAVLNVYIGIVRDLDDIQALSEALAADLAARANSDGEPVDLMYAHAHAIVHTYAHALDLARTDAITQTCAADPDLLRDLGLTGARALAEAVIGDATTALHVARSRAAELAEVIDADMSILGAFDFDVNDAIRLAHAHERALDRADVLARGVAGDPDPELARVFGITSVRGLDPALPLPGVLGLSLRWVAEGPLASTLLGALAGTRGAAGPRAPAETSVPGRSRASAETPVPAETSVLAETPVPVGAPVPGETRPADPEARPRPGDLYLAFANALCSRAGINETTRLRAGLDRSLTDALRALEAAGPRPIDGTRDGTRDGVRDENPAPELRRLAEACAAMSDTHQAPSPPDAAAQRAVALALAASVREFGAADVLRTAAATITLVENRGKTESDTGESIILALA
ncbi:MAG: NACHT domain-containing protein [Nocardiopsaceae bacterium]|nr:NACHT domain-containing protein [Nocardiopsaceae bacterium]